MSENQVPPIGSMKIDGSDVKVTALSKEQRKRCKKLRNGASKAVACLARLTPEHVERAGLNPAIILALVEYMQEYERAGELLPVAQRMAELLNDTQCDRGSKIANAVGEMAVQARRRCKKDPLGDEVLAQLDELFEYHFGPAAKALATRQKALTAKKAKAEEAVTKPQEPTG